MALFLTGKSVKKSVDAHFGESHLWRRGGENIMRSITTIDESVIAGAQRYLCQLAETAAADQESCRSWERFYHLCDEVVRRYVATHPLPADEAEDCVQDVWISLVRRLRTWRYDPQRGRFETWLYRLVQIVASDRMRGLMRRRRLKDRICQSWVQGECDDEASPSQQHEGRTEFEALLKEIRGNVSQVNYRLLKRRWIEDVKVAEVAAELGLSSAQVWFREHRMRKKLRRVLAKSSGGCATRKEIRGGSGQSLEEGKPGSSSPPPPSGDKPWNSTVDNTIEGESQASG
jgi:RNA polymerase sigma-70 factor (ECF subfamily)